MLLVFSFVPFVFCSRFLLGKALCCYLEYDCGKDEENP